LHVERGREHDGDEVGGETGAGDLGCEEEAAEGGEGTEETGGECGLDEGS
jgi:hypothetical protein